MADEPKQAAEEAAESSDKAPASESPAEAGKAAKGAGPAWIPVVAVSVIALSLGVVTGGMVIGPRFAGGKASAPASHDRGEHDEEADEGKDAGGHGEKGKKGAMLKLENIIVNPSGSEGARFLMVTVALEVGTKTEARLREREDQVRDAVIGVLERQTMETLTQPGARDRIKEEIAKVIRAMPGVSKSPRVYLPQFVIQ